MSNGKNDLRLHVGWPYHPKVVRLKRALGADGPLALITLWCYAAEHKPDGNLAGMEDDEIEAAANWPGALSVLVHALKRYKLLDEDGMLHNWTKEQKYLITRQHRQEVAIINGSKGGKASAKARIEKAQTKSLTEIQPLLSSPLLSSGREEKEGIFSLGSDPESSPGGTPQNPEPTSPQIDPPDPSPSEGGDQEGTGGYAPVPLQVVCEKVIILWNEAADRIYASTGREWLRHKTMPDRAMMKIKSLNDEARQSKRRYLQDIIDAISFVEMDPKWTEAKASFIPNLNTLFDEERWKMRVEGGAAIREREAKLDAEFEEKACIETATFRGITVEQARAERKAKLNGRVA